jgi:hypothetical protein
MLRTLTSRLFSPRVASPPTPLYPIHVPATGASHRGNALLSYLADSISWSPDHPKLLTHSNLWECREIARLLTTMGYDVDAINWNDITFNPRKPYDLIIDIDANLQRIAPLMPEKSVRILHLTGSYGPYQNRAELAQVAAFEERTGKLYSPRRLLRWVDLTERSLRLAHHCSLIGNDTTFNTYPGEYRDKITLVPVSASALHRVRMPGDLCPEKREFLWFFGHGAVHKGLDLVLEVFRNHPELKLHVVGYVEAERDFMAAYKNHLSQPNIRFHGPLAPGEPRFADVLKDVFCFIAPSCSEGISPATVTCLQLGIFPVISRQTGVTLPPDCGIVLDGLNPIAIEKAIQSALSLDASQIIQQTRACQVMALQQYSRQAFSKAYSDFLQKVISPC